MQPSNHLPGVDKMFIKVPKEGFYPASKKSMKDTKSVKVIHMWSVERDVSRKIWACWGPFLLQIRPFFPPLISLRFACQHISWAPGESHQAKHQSLLLDSTLEKNTTPIGFQLPQALHTLYGWKNMKCKEMFWNHKATYAPPDKSWTHVIIIVIYIYGPVLVASDITMEFRPVLSPILPPPSDSPCWRLPPRHCPHSQSLGLSKSVAVTTGWTQM